MSYTLCVWDPARHAPIPTSDVDALATMERLQAVPDSPSHAMRAFGSALTDAWNALPPDKRGKNGVAGYWGSDPAFGVSVSTTAVFRLVIPVDECFERILLAVRAAQPLGLVVCDDENGMCFLPDGTIFPEGMREGWAFDVAELAEPPRDPNAPDGRTFWQQLGSALVDVIGQENRRGGR